MRSEIARFSINISPCFNVFHFLVNMTKTVVFPTVPASRMRIENTIVKSVNTCNSALETRNSVLELSVVYGTDVAFPSLTKAVEFHIFFTSSILTNMDEYQIIRGR